MVCYADILGFVAMTERALESGTGTEFLQRIKGSLATAYDKVHQTQTLDGMVPSIFDMKVFTDNIVVAYPVRDPNSVGEPELATLLMLFAQVQAGLAADGFFLRGGIAAGEHYQDEDIVYGDALLEAVRLDKSGGPPRLVIGQSVEPLILEHLSWYGGGPAPHYEELLEDPSDERLFVNYLKMVVFDDFPDGPIHCQLLSAHRENVLRGLQEHESDSQVRPKYEWLATYHNYVCRTFASRYPLPSNPETDPETVAARVGAQRSLEYLVPFDGLPLEKCPRPLDAQRLQQRLTRLDGRPSVYLNTHHPASLYEAFVCRVAWIDRQMEEIMLSRAAAKHTTVAERKCTTGVMPEGADLGVGVATGTVVGGRWEDYGPACSGAEDSVAFCRLPLRR